MIVKRRQDQWIVGACRTQESLEPAFSCLLHICELPNPQTLPQQSVTPPRISAPHAARFRRPGFPAAGSAAPAAAPPLGPPSPPGGEGRALPADGPGPHSLFGPFWGVANRRRRTSFQSMTDSRAAAPAFVNRYPRRQPAASLRKAAGAARPPPCARAEAGSAGKTVSAVTAESGRSH